MRAYRGTHCNRGHEFTPENTGRTPEGHRYCRTCKNARERRLRWERSKSGKQCPVCGQKAPKKRDPWRVILMRCCEVCTAPIGSLHDPIPVVPAEAESSSERAA